MAGVPRAVPRPGAAAPGDHIACTQHRTVTPLRLLLNSLLYFPSSECYGTPADAGLSYDDVPIETDDGETLHGWWIPTAAPARGHVLLFHGNGGNVCDRVPHAGLLVAAGFDVLLFDYRGYGRSTGRPSEEGTYRDARAALGALVDRVGADPSAILYLGESLGGAVALALALEKAPRGLVLQSAFTSVREVARVHYPFVPSVAVPDAYPSLGRISALEAPLLVLHGDRDEVVPLAHGRALYDAAPEPKRLQVVQGAGHDDLVVRAGPGYARSIADWAEECA